MKMRRHRIPLDCPKCGQPVTIQSLWIAADLEISADLLCIPCGKELNWKNHAQEMAAQAFYIDLEDRFQETLTPKKPKPAKPAPPITEDKPLTPEDLKWLREFGADDEEAA
jgi:endogenous inhibitor of DNA gyrase (YacG/DUF329 family)